jgi:tRNA isopentenyl-2-thiomethyl-A-37 hydroxylase MiaE
MSTGHGGHAEPLAGICWELQRFEARHFEPYLDCAAAAAPGGAAQWRARLAALAAVEAELISAPDEALRIHSGPPRGSSLSA